MRRRLLRPIPIKLVSVAREKQAAALLYELLKERTPDVNISHQKLPTFKKHASFVRWHPYRAWYLIKIDEDYVGSIYLSMQDEIGIFILKDHQGHGYGSTAIRALIEKHPERTCFLANVNPANKRSAKMFGRLGFTLLQHTYVCYQ